MKKVWILVSLISALTSCGYNNLSHIEDINGADNYSLNTLTEKDLVSTHPHCLTNMSVSSNKDNEYIFHCKVMSGVLDLYKFSGEKTFNFNSIISSGNGKLYVFSGKKIIHDIKLNGETSFTIKDVSSYSIRLAGESLNIDLNFKETK